MMINSVCGCVHVWVRACVGACMCGCVRACVGGFYSNHCMTFHILCYCAGYFVL